MVYMCVCVHCVHSVGGGGGGSGFEMMIDLGLYITPPQLFVINVEGRFAAE